MEFRDWFSLGISILLVWDIYLNLQLRENTKKIFERMDKLKEIGEKMNAAN